MLGRHTIQYIINRQTFKEKIFQKKRLQEIVTNKKIQEMERFVQKKDYRRL